MNRSILNEIHERLQLTAFTLFFLAGIAALRETFEGRVYSAAPHSNNIAHGLFYSLTDSA